MQMKKNKVLLLGGTVLFSVMGGIEKVNSAEQVQEIKIVEEKPNLVINNANENRAPRTAEEIRNDINKVSDALSNGEISNEERKAQLKPLNQELNEVLDDDEAIDELIKGPEQIEEEIIEVHENNDDQYQDKEDEQKQEDLSQIIKDEQRDEPKEEEDDKEEKFTIEINQVLDDEKEMGDEEKDKKDADNELNQGNKTKDDQLNTSKLGKEELDQENDDKDDGNKIELQNEEYLNNDNKDDLKDEEEANNKKEIIANANLTPDANTKETIISTPENAQENQGDTLVIKKETSIKTNEINLHDDENVNKVNAVEIAKEQPRTWYGNAWNKVTQVVTNAWSSIKTVWSKVKSFFNWK